MSRRLQDYRSVQIDIRAIEAALSSINDEEKSHPDKATNHDSLAHQAQWGKIKGELDRRRAYLRKQLATKEEEKASLYLELEQTPLSLFSVAEMIDKLTYIEGLFSTQGTNAAWDAVTNLTDKLETDEARVKELRAA